MKRPMTLKWTLLTVLAAGLLTALSLVSCAPTHHSFALSGQSSGNPSPAENNQPTPQASASAISALAGDWICEDHGSGCPVDEISLSPDGTAVADGQAAKLLIQLKSQATVHMTITLASRDGAHATMLAGDVNMAGNLSQITLNQAIYDRMAPQDAAN